MKISTPFYILFFLTLNLVSQETIAIPDIGLEECLIDLDIDSNGLNGTILVEDAKHVINLNINDPLTNKLLPNVHSKVKDLTGLEHFPNLKRIDCFNNNITKIDLSKSTSITFLNCNENQIESLNLANNTKLAYVSCDNNKISSLILGENTKLESLYCSFNNLTSLNVKGCTKLESLDTTGNKISGILVNETQFNNIPEGWYKDQNAIYTTNKNDISTPVQTVVKKEVVTKTTPQPIVKKTPSTVNSQPKESTSNYYEKFQLSVVSEYDQLVLAANHTQSKKNELQQKYSLNAQQLSQWITKYASLLTTDKNKFTTTDVGLPKKFTPAYYSKFKKSAVDEYEKAILNPAYLQSKKEEIQKKYNLNSEQFTQWINLLGNSALKAKTAQPTESAKSFYDKFKKSVAKEYEYLVLNATHLQSKKSQIQQKYNLTAAQLNEWIKKHSKVKTL
ncbi:leucine-rich repeat domain-containing protein [Tenacibaculum insulae]|uniref:leucine-rich repeat domain-containing protein n=1 Tax=Tenacibaculum insulae TaxID=2029677 RepID=UPI003AB6F7EB